MNLKKLVLGMSLAFFSLSAFALSNDNTNATDQSSNSQATSKHTANDQQVNNQDGQVVAWLIILNKNEVAAAKLAQQKAKSAAVKKYAAKMIKEHSKNLQETLKLSKKDDVKPVDSEDSNSLKQKGQDALNDLKSKEGQDFQSAYMDNMVEGHQAVLDKLDQIIPNVSNPELKHHLENTRKHVEQHLEAAKKVQDQIKSQS